MAAKEDHCDDEKIEGCPYEIEKDVELFRGRWMGAREVHFLDRKSGVRKVWQSAFRSTKPEGIEVDGVDIIATLFRENGSRKDFIFVKQYRIPVNAVSLEFPAGLVDPNETVEQAGLRELKEETGYTATRVISCSRGAQALDPGLTNDTVQFLRVEVNGDLPENQDPKQSLDEGEHVEVVLVPCNAVLEAMQNFTQDGICVEAMLYSFAIAYDMARDH